ncbi:MAG TPA: transcription elongation factor GreAB [Cryomorphaceae bacterium]|nr:transcription elongation factor GreAB [Owenweeksia sp.]MBF98940.1 transcription elongation factor GreAB [Owenweeksia sp.]HAD97553.1 transcription elongation factor GreAB [Cryomorphaceae bacterium]HBF19909.1 transcription elongation factor GreAB [Cryomorphaceae bacterium]HCQ14609.1 transcription elongation factor GreAB [Cryomorphaceae bacterium]|tara:strand:- start:469 stop:801 length:333 start_codon:yes stop_codon:yes gene_type:complete
MRQGEIWEMYFDPTKGREQSGRRPAVIISGNLLNKYLDVVIVCPLTTSVKNYKGNVVLQPDSFNGLKQASEILTFHIRSVSKDRLKKKIGAITRQQLDDIKLGLNDILRY